MLALVSVSCTSGAAGTGSAVTTSPAARPPNSSEAVSAASGSPVPPGACAADNDPLTVAKTFVVAAEAGDQVTIARCTYPTAPLGADLVSIAASGGLLLDQVQPVRENSRLKVGPNTVGFEFSYPPQPRNTIIGPDGQPRSAGDDYQSGVAIAVTLEPDGRRYVTDILGFASG